MSELIKHLFQNTLNPNPVKRKESEEKLQELLRNKEFIYSLPETFMRDKDPIIRQVSATFFKNAVANDLDVNAVDLALKDPGNAVIFGEILTQQVAREKHYSKEFQNILKAQVGSNALETALLIVNAYVERDRAKYSCAATTHLMKDINPSLFFEKLKHCNNFRKTLAKIFDNFYVADRLLDKDFLASAISFALNFTDKDSAAFLIRVSTRSFKGLLNSKEIERGEEIRNYFYNLRGFDQYKAEYFILYSQSLKEQDVASQDILNSLIETLIIPNIAYKDIDTSEDLKMKYNYSDDTYNSCSLLFADILKCSMKKNEILQYMKNLLKSQNPKDRYVGLSLFVQAEPLLRDYEVFDEFVELMKTCLEDPEQLVKSQAFYALQFTDAESLGKDLLRVFNIVLEGLSSSDEALKTNAALSLPIFFNTDAIKAGVERNLPIILNTLVQNPLHLEQIGDALENVINSFDVSCYAVDLCKKMIESVKVDNIETTPYLRIISDLILTLEGKKDVVLKIYQISLPTVCYIIKNRKYDFFIEVIDILSNVLYVFKTGDQNILELLDIILDSDPKELINCSEEMTYLLDNYISYCNVTDLKKLMRFINLLCYQNDEFLFEDDFINGCKIMESLILNGKYISDTNHLEHFLKIVFDNYSKLENNSLLYGLEILMNALNVDVCSGFSSVYMVFKQNMDAYLTNMYSIRKRFSRVHDKKIGLLFCANIMRFKDMFDIGTFLGLFTHLLYTYDQAEVVRKRLKNNEEFEGDDETECDDSDEYLEEDVYFCTPLDSFEIKAYLKSTFASLESDTFGFKVFGGMDPAEKEKVLRIINN